VTALRATFYFPIERLCVDRRLLGTTHGIDVAGRRILLTFPTREAAGEGGDSDPDLTAFPNPEPQPFPLIEGGRDEWTPAVKAAGLAHRTPYSLRHTYAAFSIAAGVSLFALARRMGTSVEQIGKTYGHLLPDAVEYERGLPDTFDAQDIGQRSASRTD
jgi:hypothetical protein